MSTNTKNMKQKIKEYAEAIKAANEAAIKASKLVPVPETQEASGFYYRPEMDPSIDGGTCNFDTPILDFKGWRQTSIDEVEKLSGVKIGDKLESWPYKGSRLLWVELKGQAANRTRMAEAAARILKDKGMPASVWYQAD